MKSKAASFRALVAPRIILSTLGIVIALTGLAAFLVSQVSPVETTWPALGRAIRPLDQWRQISALLLAAFGIVILFLRPEKLPDRLVIRKGVEDTDPRRTEKRQTSWMLVLSALFVAVWVGILELPSRNVVSPEGRVLLLAGAVLVQWAALFWLLRYVGKRQRRLGESHGAAELPRCPRAVQALLSPGVGFLLGLGTLGLWVGFLLALSGAWPQILGLPPAAEGPGALLDVMRLTADKMVDTLLFGIPGEYGLALTPSGPHSWIGATILAVFRLTVSASLFFLLYLTIRARQTYARLTRRVLQESSEEAGAALAAIGRPAGRALAREAFRLRTKNGEDSDQPAAKALLFKTMYEFYHPKILEFALREGNDPDAMCSDRVEALKYVCTYGDQGTALDLLGRFFHSGHPDLREAVSLICVAFEHPDCDRLLDEMSRKPQTADEYRNAVIGAGVRLTNERADRSGVAACLEALPGLLRCPAREARPTLEGMSLLATFAAQEVKKEIQAAWRKMPGGTKLYCLEILLKIRAGLLPDPEFLRSVLSNAEPESDETEGERLLGYITQEDVGILIEISQDQDPQIRAEACEALAGIQANRTDLVVEMPQPAGLLAPESEPDFLVEPTSPEGLPTPQDEPELVAETPWPEGLPAPQDESDLAAETPWPEGLPAPQDESDLAAETPLPEGLPAPQDEPDLDILEAPAAIPGLTPLEEDGQETQDVTEDIVRTPYRIAKPR
jgi:hypothetical protein